MNRSPELRPFRRKVLPAIGIAGALLLIAFNMLTLWFIGSVIMIVTPAVLLWSLFGGLGGPTYYLYHFGVLVCLLASIASFVGFLRLSPRRT